MFKNPIDIGYLGKICCNLTKKLKLSRAIPDRNGVELIKRDL